MKSVFSFRAFVAAVAIATISFAGVADAQEKSKSSKTATAKPVAAKPVAKPVARAVATPEIRPLSVEIALLSTTKLKGTLTDTTTVEMRTSFGAASIPLSEVAGIRFASADNASTTVVMLNGDSITGATDVKLVTVETEWGIATINGPNISSILFVPGLTWSPQAGLNGKRWSLLSNKSSSNIKTSVSSSNSSRNGSTARVSLTGRSSIAPVGSYPSNGVPVQRPTFRGR